MSHRRRAFNLRCAVCLSLWIASALSAARQQHTRPNDTVLKDFQKRVSEYVKLHKAEEAVLPPLKPTESAAKIARHERALAAGIRTARSTARQGDIFTPEIAAEFRRLLGIAMEGARKDRVRQSLRSAEPVSVPLRVNAPYPSKLPRQSAPPTILLNLPQLPAELRYGIVDHDLILQDIGANLIVDYIPAALP